MGGSCLGWEDYSGGGVGSGKVLGGRARGGRQVGRCGFAFTPAFGRAVASATRRFMARLKPCPFEGSVSCGCGGVGTRYPTHAPSARA
jgi:hypothetical protein